MPLTLSGMEKPKTTPNAPCLTSGRKISSKSELSLDNPLTNGGLDTLL